MPRMGLAAARQKTVFKEVAMLWTIAVVLLILWILGVVSANVMGGFIHVLLVLAIVAVLLRVIRGPRLIR